MVHALLAVALLAAPTRYVLLPLECPKTLPASQCTALQGAIASELRRYPNTQLLTQDDVKAVMKNDAARNVFGCDDPSCYSDVSKALNAPFLIRGSYSTLGESQFVSLTVIEAAKVRVSSAASVRIRSQKIDDALDALPKLGSQVFEQLGVQARTVAAMMRLPPKNKKGTAKMPIGFEDIPLDSTLPERMVFLKDAAGNIIAFDETEHRLLLAGTSGALWKQSVGTRSRSGNTKFSFGFWDPRFERRGFTLKDGVYELVCGKKTITYTPVSDAEAKRLKGKARVFAPRWQRYPTALARNNRGEYFFVDRVRSEDKQTGEVEDYRLFIGRKGRVAHVPLEDAIVDQAGAVFLTADGRLVLENTGERERVAKWFVGEQETPLVDVQVWSSAKMIYTRLGSYSGQPLGTACDPYI
ncbi:MAG: hypothetical protein AAFQ82_24835 [Myxococcota bacterium]